MDSVSNKNNNIIVTMLHNYEQDPKIVKNCSLPITGKGVVSKIITEKGVFEVVPGEGLTMTEIAKGEELEQIKELTACEFKVSSNLSEMKQS